MLAMNTHDSGARIEEDSTCGGRSKSKSLLYYSSCLGRSEVMWTSEEELGHVCQCQMNYCLWGVKGSCKRLEGPDAVGEHWWEQQGLGASGRWERMRNRQCLKPVGLGLWGLWLVQFCGAQGVAMFSQAGGWDPVVDGGCPAISSGRTDGAWGCTEVVWEGPRWRGLLFASLLFRCVVYAERAKKGCWERRCPLCASWESHPSAPLRCPVACCLGVRSRAHGRTISSCLALLQAAVLRLACKALNLAFALHNKTRNVSTLASVQHLVHWQWRDLWWVRLEVRQWWRQERPF